MKLSSILPVLFFLLISASCSMEEDLIMNDVKKEMAAGKEPATGELNAYVAFDLHMTGSQTKAEVAAADKAIHNVVLFLLEGNTVVASKYTENYADEKFLVKVPMYGTRKLKAMAIVNVSGKTKTELLSQATLSGINSVAFNEEDLRGYIKVGTDEEVTLEGSEGETSTPGVNKEGGYYTVKANITVKQMTSRVELSGFTYTIAEGTKAEDVKEVKLISAQLIQANKVGNVEGYERLDYDAVSLYKELELDTNGLETPVYIGSSFPNGATNPTTMVIRFAVDGKEYTKSYIINRPETSEADHHYIQSGFIYYLSVKMAVSKDSVQPEIVCYTKDWVSKDIDIEL